MINLDSLCICIFFLHDFLSKYIYIYIFRVYAITIDLFFFFFLIMSFCLEICYFQKLRIKTTCDYAMSLQNL